MNIPKIIHYCWFGNGEMSNKQIECIKSWKLYCPDYKFILWNERNCDLNCNKYVKQAYSKKKWAFVSDYFRLEAVYNFGGIYLDTDVELVKSIDNLLLYNAFMAVEQDFNVATGLGFGACPENKVIGEMLEIYEKMVFINEDGSLNLKAAPFYSTEYFTKYGYRKDNSIQNVCGVHILSSEFFCPLNYKTGKITMTNNTYGIHWYSESWKPKTDVHIRRTELYIHSKFNGVTGNILCKIYRNIYRFAEYLKDGTLIQNIKRKYLRK